MPSLADLGQYPPERPSFLAKLGQTWPAKVAQTALSALGLPGDVWSGRQPMVGEDGRTDVGAIGRAAELGGLATLGAYTAPAMRNTSGAGIRAYHGSAADFNRFDISKMGTGEGAQVYGRGLYFAENPKVAEYYRNTVGGKNGRTYEVNINAKADDFLPWGERLTNNPELIERLRSVVPPEKLRSFDHAVQVGNGETIYKDILGADVRWRAPAITQSLREAGVPGIKYFDQASRIGDSGTRNFVVFDDKIIDIIRKYGFAGLAPVGAAGGLAVNGQDN